MSYTKAAAELFVSQPTLTRHIQELEAELGTPLFIRHSHSLQLTDAGAQFLPAANDVLRHVDNLTHMFGGPETAQRTPTIIRVAYLAAFTMGAMFTLLDQFKQQHPDVQYVMDKQNAPLDLADGLAAGKFDLAFGLASYLQNQPDIRRALFMANRLQIALPVDHPLSSHRSLRFADLKQETFILLERQQSPVIVDYVINQGLQNGFNLRAKHYVNNLDEGLTMVAAGKGLAFLYSGMNDGSLEERYHIRIADVAGEDLDQNIVVAIPKHNRGETVNKLYAFITKQAVH